MRPWAALALLALAGPAAAQTDGVLTLEQAYTQARARSPMLRAAGALADATETREASAGLPPDPTIQLGFMNLSLPGFSADMPNSMAPSVQAMQMVPWPGKLGASRRVAEQGTEMARAGAAEAWWEVRSRVAAAFYDVWEADRRLDVMRETLGLLRDFEAVARSLYATGEGRQSDVLRAGVEVARMSADSARMAALRGAAVARLNGMLDRGAGTPVGHVAFSPLPLTLPPADTLRTWAAADRPLLEKGRAAVEQAGARRDLARREIWPDPVLGVQYGRRAGEHMGSVMLGFSLPVFAASRQLRVRDEAEAMTAMARAELDDARAQVDARTAELLAELERTRTLAGLYTADVLPQAQAAVESAFSSYRVGRVDFLTLLDARMTVNRFEQERIALLAEYGRFLSELESTIGRPIPASGDVLAEAS